MIREKKLCHGFEKWFQNKPKHLRGLVCLILAYIVTTVLFFILTNNETTRHTLIIDYKYS